MTTQPSPTHEPIIDLLSEDKVAEILHLSVATIRKWRCIKKGPAWYSIGRNAMYKKKTLNYGSKDNELYQVTGDEPVLNFPQTSLDFKKLII